MGMVANLLAMQQDYSSAIDIRLEMLDVVEKTVGPNHPFYPIVLGAIGRLYLLNGSTDRAGELLLDALSRFHEINPDGAVTSIIMFLEITVVHYYTVIIMKPQKPLTQQ